MSNLQTDMDLAKQKFPVCGILIENLYKTDPDFKSLCADIFLCTNMMRELEAEIDEKQHALKEFQAIGRELENDMLKVIGHKEMLK